MAFTTGNDINILQPTDLTNVNAGAGNDRYVLSPSVLSAGQSIVIGDTVGANTLQLEGGLSITSSSVANDAVQLTLSNGATVTILGANSFNFQTGGSPTSGLGGVIQNFANFVTQSLGTTVPAPGAGNSAGGSVTVNQAGGTTAGPAPTPPNGGPAPVPPAAPNYTLTTGVDNISTTQTAGNSNGVADLNTLTNGDRILDESTTDNDTLTADLLSNLDSTVTITNIENVNLNVLAGTSTVDTSNLTGIKTLAMRGAGNLTLTNLKSTTTALKLDGSSGSLSATFSALVVSGGSDIATVEVSKSTSGTLTIGPGIETLRLRTNGGETSTITSINAGTANTLQLTGTGDITIGNLANPNAIGSAVTTVDARTAGKATLFLQGSATTAVLTGGADDTIRFDAGLDAGNIINLGAGKDTLTLGGNLNNAAVISGVENINLTAANSSIAMTGTQGAVALDFQGGAGVTVTDATAGTSVRTSGADTTGVINVGLVGTARDQAIMLDLSSKVATANVTVSNAADVTISATRAGAQTLGMVTLDAVGGATDTTKKLTLEAKGAGVVLNTGAIMSATTLTDLTLKTSGVNSRVNLGQIANADALKTLVVAAASSGAEFSNTITSGIALDVIDIEVGAANLVANTAKDIVAQNVLGITTVALKATGGNIGSSALNGDLAIENSTGFKTVNTTGAGDTFATLTSLAGKVETVLSTATGGTKLTINNNLAADVAGTVATLGNAADTKQNELTIVGTGKDTVIGGSGTDVINAGAAEDSISGGGGADRLTGGLGNDIFVFADQASTRNSKFEFANSTSENIDRITDFTGNGTTAGDRFSINQIETGTAVNFVSTTVANVAARNVATANSFTDLADGLNTTFLFPTAVAASTQTTAQVLDVTVAGGSLAGRYLIINDGAAGVQTADFIINITGLSEAIDASDFLFV